MNEHQLVALLKLVLETEREEGALDEFYDGVEAAPALEQVSTFGEAGVLSGNQGLVLRFADGSEFQLQIVRSR